MKYKNKLDWQITAIELIEKFTILTACELEILLKKKGFIISRSQIYRFCANEPLIHSSPVLKGSKTLAYRTARALSSLEQYTILLHNEYFINKNMAFPKPQTKDSLFKYIPYRFKQLSATVGEDQTIKDEIIKAQKNYEQQEKLNTPSSFDMSTLFKIIQNNRIQFISSEKISWWVMYDTPNNSYESFKRKLILLQDFLIKKNFDSFSTNVEIISFEERKMQRYISSFNKSPNNKKIINIKVCIPNNK